MRIKRIMLFVLLLCSISFLCSCDSGLEIVKAEIVSYPERIIYIKDVDKELSVDGLCITATTRDGREDELYDYGKYETDADFLKEGVYEVTYMITDEISVSFPIQVVSKEWIEQY